MLQRDLPVDMYRTFVTLSDGEVVALDWGAEREGGGTTIPPDAPIMLIIAGLTGSSMCTYTQYLVADGLYSGYRPVVFNQRGTGGMAIKVKCDRILRKSNILNSFFVSICA